MKHDAKRKKPDPKGHIYIFLFIVFPVYFFLNIHLFVCARSGMYVGSGSMTRDGTPASCIGNSKS